MLKSTQYNKLSKIEEHTEISSPNKTENSIIINGELEKLVNLYPENCFYSGKNWGLEKNIDKSFNDEYIDLMGDSYFSLCPRGTGISSIRLFICRLS